MPAWEPIRYLRNGDVSIAYAVGGEGPADPLFINGFVGHEGAQAIGLELRAGVHTGECEVTANDLAGIAVHLTARVEAAARPGEVLTTSTVKDLVVGSGPEFEDRAQDQTAGAGGSAAPA